MPPRPSCRFPHKPTVAAKCLHPTRHPCRAPLTSRSLHTESWLHMSHAIQLQSDGRKAGKLRSRVRQAGSRHSCRQRDPLWEWTEGTCLTTVPRHMTKLLKSRLGCHSSSLLVPLLQPVTSPRGRPSLKWSKSLQNPLRPRRPRHHAVI